MDCKYLIIHYDVFNEVVVKQKHKCQIASVTVVNRMSLPFIALLGGLISMNLAICTMFPKFT